MTGNSLNNLGFAYLVEASGLVIRDVELGLPEERLLKDLIGYGCISLGCLR